MGKTEEAGAPARAGEVVLDPAPAEAPRSRPRAERPEPRRQRFGSSIGQRLGLLICALQLALVASLAMYFGREQSQSLSRELSSKAETYAKLVSAQVRSAVAFEDKETAREVFDSVASDPDLIGAILFDGSGRALHTWGSPGRVAEQASGGLEAAKLFELPDRFLAVSPVQSLEGPRGTLTLELGKSKLVEAQAELRWTGALVGGLALLLGGGLALLIAQSFGRRLRAISVVAEKVAAGDLSQQAVTDRSLDEIGSLARSFAGMLEEIRRLFGEARARAAEEQSRLEALVRERTLALEERNLDMRRVLDNVEQGFIEIDRRGVMSKERSAIVERWLGAPPASGALWDYIDQACPGMRAPLESAWSQVFDGLLPLELTLDQMPRRFSVGRQHFAISYHPILGPDSELERAVVVLSDVTPSVERERAELSQREALRLFSCVSEDRAGVVEFFAEARRLVHQITAQTPKDACITKRLIHTLKGNAGVFGVERLSRLCHAIEETMEDSNTNIGDAERQLLVESWTEMNAQLSHLLGESNKTDLTISEADYGALLHALASGRSASEVAAMAETWRLEPTEVRLRRAAQQAMILAERLGKAPLEVRVESNGLRLDPELWRDVWAELPHLLRNAIDHGLEGPGENGAAPTEPSTLSLRTYLDALDFVIEVEDSGRGVSWERVREAALEKGLPATTQADLEHALFVDGVTTKDTAEEMSGRGVGMAAIAATVRASGGEIRVYSRAPGGTRVRMSWPAAAARARDSRSASVSSLQVVKPQRDPLERLALVEAR